MEDIDIVKEVLEEFPTAVNDDNYLDFINIGNKALILAHKTYDEKNNYDFNSYAFQVIECEIISHIMGYSSVISISDEMLNSVKIFSEKKEKIEKELNRSLSVVELVNKLEYPIDQIVTYIKYNLFSLQSKKEINEIKDHAIEDILISTRM